MKLIAVLSWYDESPSWLAGCVSALCSRCRIDHLIAVDGAYGLFPGGRGSSGPEQHAVIHETAAAGGAGVTIHAPGQPWDGNEVEKRAFAFALAETVSTPDDWYFVIDADEVVTSSPDLHQLLAVSDLDVATVTLVERHDPHATEETADAARSFVWDRESRSPSHRLFRAHRGLRPVGNHFTYLTANGPVHISGRADTTDARVEVEHRTRFRDLSRRQLQQRYYDRRDRLGIESI